MKKSKSIMHIPSDSKMLIDIARRYYIRQESQIDIADALNLTQTVVSRYAKMARKLGVVRISIDPYFTQKLGQSLHEVFTDVKCIVVPVTSDGRGQGDQLLLQEIGENCAEYLVQKASPKAKIGVSCGSTIEAFTRAVKTLASVPHI